MPPHYTTTLHNQANQTRDHDKPTTVLPRGGCCDDARRISADGRGRKIGQMGGRGRDGEDWPLGNKQPDDLEPGKKEYMLSLRHASNQGRGSSAGRTAHPPASFRLQILRTHTPTCSLHPHIYSRRTRHTQGNRSLVAAWARSRAPKQDWTSGGSAAQGTPIHIHMEGIYGLVFPSDACCLLSQYRAVGESRCDKPWEKLACGRKQFKDGMFASEETTMPLLEQIPETQLFGGLAAKCR